MAKNMKKLSIVIPVFNEINTIENLLSRVESVDLGLEKEIILIDDKSTDGTRDKIRALESKYKVILQDFNKGKGAALRRGFQEASGDFILVQDADLEYDPNEYPTLLEPLLDGRADVVYGSRFVGHKPHRVLFFWHYMGNKFLTLFSNMLTDLNLTDMETCYKVFSKNALDSFKDKLESNRFGIEPEITSWVSKRKLRIYEVGISYSGRTYAEGKKINWKDGLSAIWSIIKFNLL